MSAARRRCSVEQGHVEFFQHRAPPSQKRPMLLPGSRVMPGRKTRQEDSFAELLDEYLPPVPPQDAEFPVREILDLHGFEREEALEKVRDHVISAARIGMAEVRIIYGRGRHSLHGQPVLREHVQKLLRGELRPYVQRFKSAPRRQGGEGVAVVYLSLCSDR